MAKRRGSSSAIGSWAFLIGVILAVVLGFIGSVNQTWVFIFVIIGLIIGLLNVSEGESSNFLMAGLVLIVASGLGGSVLNDVPRLDGSLQALLAIFTPAVIIVSIKHVFNLARN